MNGQQLLNARLNRQWEQLEAAEKLKVSQPYLSLLEAGKRPVTEHLAKRAVQVFKLPPTVLPLGDLSQIKKAKNSDFLDLQIAALGYPKFSHLKKSRKIKRVNPALVLITALHQSDLDSRTLEAMPWLIYNFPEMNWSKIIREAKFADGQNRLGFLISLAYEKSKQTNDDYKKQNFKDLLSSLQKSRLYEEDSFRRESLTKTEKAWLKKNGSKVSRFWRVLTNLTVEQLVF